MIGGVEGQQETLFDIKIRSELVSFVAADCKGISPTTCKQREVVGDSEPLEFGGVVQ